jgi:hypothetical protein
LRAAAIEQASIVSELADEKPSLSRRALSVLNVLNDYLQPRDQVYPGTDYPKK